MQEGEGPGQPVRASESSAACRSESFVVVQIATTPPSGIFCSDSNQLSSG